MRVASERMRDDDNSKFPCLLGSLVLELSRRAVAMAAKGALGNEGVRGAAAKVGAALRELLVPIEEELHSALAEVLHSAWPKLALRTRAAFKLGEDGSAAARAWADQLGFVYS